MRNFLSKHQARVLQILGSMCMTAVLTLILVNLDWQVWHIVPTVALFSLGLSLNTVGYLLSFEQGSKS